MAFTNNDNAISQTVGTLLMVAITVMLGVIILTYAVGMSSSIQNTRVVATSVTINS